MCYFRRQLTRDFLRYVLRHARNRVHHVRDGAVVPIDDVDDVKGTEHACVEGLAARSGIKDRPIEHNRGPALARFDALNRGVTFPAIRIRVIQTVSHCLFATS